MAADTIHLSSFSNSLLLKYYSHTFICTHSHSFTLIPFPRTTCKTPLSASQSLHTKPTAPSYSSLFFSLKSVYSHFSPTSSTQLCTPLTIRTIFPNHLLFTQHPFLKLTTFQICAYPQVSEVVEHESALEKISLHFAYTVFTA